MKCAIVLFVIYSADIVRSASILGAAFHQPEVRTPPRPYEFSYGVADPNSLVLHSRQEQSDGTNLEGEYRTLLPDGRTQVVTYTSGPHTGFVAKVSYIGEAKPTPHHNKPKRKKRKNLFLNIRGGNKAKNNLRKKTTVKISKPVRPLPPPSLPKSLPPPPPKTVIKSPPLSPHNQFQKNLPQPPKSQVKFVRQLPKAPPPPIIHPGNGRPRLGLIPSRFPAPPQMFSDNIRQFSQQRPVYVKPDGDVKVSFRPSNNLPQDRPKKDHSLPKYGIMTDISSELPKIPPLPTENNHVPKQRKNQHHGWTSQVVLPPDYDDDEEDDEDIDEDDDKFEIKEVFNYKGPIYVNNADKKNEEGEKDIVRSMFRNPLASVRPQPVISSASTNVLVRNNKKKEDYVKKVAKVPGQVVYKVDKQPKHEETQVKHRPETPYQPSAKAYPPSEAYRRHYPLDPTPPADNGRRKEQHVSELKVLTNEERQRHQEVQKQDQKAPLENKNVIEVKQSWHQPSGEQPGLTPPNTYEQPVYQQQQQQWHQKHKQHRQQQQQHPHHHHHQQQQQASYQRPIVKPPPPPQQHQKHPDELPPLQPRHELPPVPQQYDIEGLDSDIERVSSSIDNQIRLANTDKKTELRQGDPGYQEPWRPVDKESNQHHQHYQQEPQEQPRQQPQQQQQQHPHQQQQQAQEHLQPPPQQHQQQQQQQPPLHYEDRFRFVGLTQPVPPPTVHLQNTRPINNRRKSNPPPNSTGSSIVNFFKNLF